MQAWKYREELGKQGKFRVGDLVQISSYGKGTDQNSNHHFDGNEIGLIIKVKNQPHTDKYPIKVQWINIPNVNVPLRFFFRELKLKRT